MGVTKVATGSGLGRRAPDPKALLKERGKEGRSPVVVREGRSIWRLLLTEGGGKEEEAFFPSPFSLFLRSFASGRVAVIVLF